MKKITYFCIGIFLSLFLFSIDGTAQELKIMSYNVKAFEAESNDPEVMFVLQPFADEILRHNPDVICIQELETHTSRQGRRELLTELGSLLGMYPYYGYSYTKETDGDGKGAGLYGNGILSKYPILNCHSEQLAYNSNQSYDQRSFQYTDILVPVNGKPEGQVVRIINTHLDHRSSSQNGQRTQHANYIVANALDSSIPTLMCGDMNEGPSSPAIAVFNTVFDRMCNNSGTFGGAKLDYIFGYPQGKWTSVEYTVISSFRLSDHYPIMATVKIN